MNPIVYKQDVIPAKEALKELYDSVQWNIYTKDLDRLRQAHKNSLKIISAWNGKELVGIIRAIGDGVTILYIQDLLIKPKFQRQKIGASLLKMMLDSYPDIRQKILLTDNNPSLISFYEDQGFKKAVDRNCLCFVLIS